MNKKIIKLLLVIVLVWLLLPYNILILGSDARGSNLKGSRTDGIILVKVIPIFGTIRMVSIPRDSYVEIPSKGKFDKITHAFAYGGQKESVRAVEKFLNTKVNYSVVFKFDDIVNITNILDGVEVTSNHTFIQDNYSFKKGVTYNLKGESALAYARHRKTDSDFKREERQRQLIKSIVYELISPKGIKKVPIILKYTATNMKIKYNPLRVVSSLLGLINIKQYKIEGKSMMKKGVYYFVPSDESVHEINRKFKVFI